jgi:hypothetical protein
MTELSIEPPQLTISVYSNQDERETFKQLCLMLSEFDCTPTFDIEIAPAALDFEMISDLGSSRKIIKVSSYRYDQLIRSLEPGLRALRAGYFHRKYGNVAVAYEMREGSDYHPVGVSVGAGDLGLPDSLWSAKQRRSAFKMAEWASSVLKSAASACKPLYGAIGVEYSLPTPRKLPSIRAGIPTEWFVSHTLLNREPSLEEKLRNIYADGSVTDWADGIFCSGWSPFNAERLTVEQPSKVSRDTAETLGRVFAT